MNSWMVGKKVERSEEAKSFRTAKAPDPKVFIKREKEEVSNEQADGEKSHSTHIQHDFRAFGDFPAILLVTGGNQWISSIWSSPVPR